MALAHPKMLKWMTDGDFGLRKSEYVLLSLLAFNNNHNPHSDLHRFASIPPRNNITYAVV